jgi:hypothetical protein
VKNAEHNFRPRALFKLYQHTCNQRCCGQWLGLTEALLNHELCLDCQLRLSVDLVALTSKQDVRHAS